ncbi:MAG: hypothetical protein WAQ05_18290, partial [Rubrivivax sp.]
MNSPNDGVRGPVADDVQTGCEQVLRTLPGWFGIELSLRGYAEATATLPTFVAEDGGAVLGFVSLLEQQPRAWEIHCI